MDAPESGLIVGRYRLVTRLALDDAGSLFTAVDVYTGQPRHLRMLWSVDAADEVRRRRFVTVANEVAARVGEYDHGVDQGHSFIAYVASGVGGDLDGLDQRERELGRREGGLGRREGGDLDGLDQREAGLDQRDGGASWTWWLAVGAVVLLVVGAFLLGRLVG